LVKVTRGDKNDRNMHYVEQLSVKILLENFSAEDVAADSRLRCAEPVYQNGDNSIVIATDTCKNTVYCVASTNEFGSIEEFGILIGKHFMKEYPTIVKSINIEILQDVWQRLEGKDSSGRVAPHKHAFQRVGPCKPYTVVTVSQQLGKSSPPPLSVSVKSGLRSLELLKTAQSGFSGFYRDRYTSLGESADRLLGTSLSAEWTFPPSPKALPYLAIRKAAVQALVNTFCGPSDRGEFSPSVQQTLYKMGEAVLTACPAVSAVRLLMPNIHNIPFPLDPYGLTNADRTGSPFIFFPIDEPHGSIQAEVQRKPRQLRARL